MVKRNKIMYLHSDRSALGEIAEPHFGGIRSAPIGSEPSDGRGTAVGDA